MDNACNLELLLGRAQEEFVHSLINTKQHFLSLYSATTLDCFILRLPLFLLLLLLLVWRCLISRRDRFLFFASGN